MDKKIAEKQNNKKKVQDPDSEMFFQPDVKIRNQQPGFPSKLFCQQPGGILANLTWHQ